MNRRWILEHPLTQAALLVALVALLSFPGSALLAQPPGPGGGPGLGASAGPGPCPGARGVAGEGHRGPGFGGHGLGGPAFLASYLDLTDEQMEQVRTLRQQRREASEPLREQGRALRRELEAELDGESPDTGRLGELTLALHQHRQEMRELREGFHQDLRALLTAEQQEALDRLVTARRERREARRERREARRESRRGGA